MIKERWNPIIQKKIKPNKQLSVNNDNVYAYQVKIATSEQSTLLLFFLPDKPCQCAT